MDIRLDFSNSFSGREEELATLIKAYNTACNEKATVCVCVNGASGSGKSSLVKAFQENLSGNALFGQGKLDQGRTSSEPFEAVASSLGDVLQKLEDSPEKETWKEKIQATLQGELQVLQTVLPLDFLNCDDNKTNASDQPSDTFQSTEKEFGFDRLRFAFRSLLRIICADQPVILFIDDLQWAELETLSLIEALVGDSFPKKNLFVGATRLERNSQAAISMMKNYEAREISLDTLSVQEITGVLIHVLRREEHEVTDLASVVARKTGGNAFAVTQFLRALEKNGILQYSIHTYRWEWDIDRVVGETELSDNVVEQVANKIRECTAAKVLKVAACLGLSRFELDILNQVRPAFQIDMELEIVLSEAEKDGLVEKMSSGDYKFAHDRIREACQTLLPTGRERMELHLMIGRLLRDGLSYNNSNDTTKNNPKESRNFFLAVNQLNAAIDCMDDKGECRDLAHMNLAAARLAMKRATLFPAVDFVKTSIRLLGPDPWKTDLDLMLALKSALARCLYSCGRLDESIEASDDVLAHSRSFKDKDTCCHVKILCLIQQGKRKEAIGLSLSVLKELGINIPRRFHKVHVIRRFLRTKKLLSQKSDEELLSLPTTDVKNFNSGIEYLVRLGEISLLWGMDDLLALVFLIGVQKTLAKGRNGMTAQCFMAWGSISAEQGDFQEAIRFGRLGLKIAKELEGGMLDQRAIGLYYTWIWHWKEPYHDGLAPFTAVMKAMWDGGALEGVFMDGSNSLRIYYCCGLKLQPLLDDARQFVELLQDYKQHGVLSLNVSFVQMIFNLAGESESLVVLNGEFMNQQDCLDSWKASQNNAALEMLYLQRLILAIYFEDDLLAGKMSTKIRNMYLEGTETYVPIRYLFKGLGALVMAKKCRKRIYLKQGRSVIKIFEKWVKKGMVNGHHMLLLLNALELSAAISDDDTVRNAFDEAIAAAGRLGFLHHQALANHRAALHFLERGDASWASTYLIRAIELYNDWGAYGVIKYLEHKHAGILVTSSSSLDKRIVSSTSVQARSRMGNISRRAMKEKTLE